MTEGTVASIPQISFRWGQPAPGRILLTIDHGGVTPSGWKHFDKSVSALRSERGSCQLSDLVEIEPSRRDGAMVSYPRVASQAKFTGHRRPHEGESH